MFLAGGLIHFGSQVQRITATSSNEAEIIAINTNAKHGLYFASLMRDLSWSKLLKFKLPTENRSALALISTGNFINRSRHIAVRYSSLRDCVRSDQISLDYVPTTTMLSDILTKPLVRELQDSIIGQVEQFVKYSTRACIAHEWGACEPVLQVG